MSMIAKNMKVGRVVFQSRILPGGRLVILTTSPEGCSVRVVDVASQKPIDSFKIALAPKYSFGFRISDEAVFVYNYTQRSVETYLLENHAQVASNDLSPFHRSVTAMAVSPNGYYYAIGDDQGGCTLWHPKIGQPRQVLKELGGRISLLRFSEDSRFLVVGGGEGTITVLEVGRPENRIEATGQMPLPVAAAMSGDFVVLGDKNGSIHVRHSDDLSLIRSIRSNNGPIRQIIGCFEGRAVLALSQWGSIALIDLTEPRSEPLLLDACGGEVVTGSFNDKTKELVVSTKEGSLIFYNLAEDREIERFFAPKEEANLKEVIDRAPNRDIKILIVDDSITMRRVITTAIQNHFPTVTTLDAGNGKEALKALVQHPDTDIMFLDWNMPIMNGEETVKAIRRAELYPDLQIVMATTEGGREKVKVMMRMGVAGYLVKPFRKEAIVKVVEKLTSRPGSKG
jgi:two-component system chemotaxis response regulator CheY